MTTMAIFLCLLGQLFLVVGQLLLKRGRFFALFAGLSLHRGELFSRKERLGGSGLDLGIERLDICLGCGESLLGLVFE